MYFLDELEFINISLELFRQEMNWSREKLEYTRVHSLSLGEKYILRLFISFPQWVYGNLTFRPADTKVSPPSTLCFFIMSHLGYYNIVLNNLSSSSFIPFYSILYVPQLFFIKYKVCHIIFYS